MLPLQIIPPDLEKIVVVDISQLDPSRLRVHLTEHSIRVLPQLPVQNPQLLRPNAPGRRLLNIDVGHTSVIDVLLDGQGEGGQRDGFSQEPIDALLSGELGQCEKEI